MIAWEKVVTEPLGIAGYSLSLVFGVVATVLKSKRPGKISKYAWIVPAAYTLAALCVLGGLALAYHQQSIAAATLKPAPPPPAPSMQIGTIDQKVDNGSAVAGVQGTVTINSQPPSKPAKTKHQAPHP